MSVTFEFGRSSFRCFVKGTEENNKSVQPAEQGNSEKVNIKLHMMILEWMTSFDTLGRDSTAWAWMMFQYTYATLLILDHNTTVYLEAY